MVEHVFHDCQVDYGRSMEIRPVDDGDLPSILRLLQEADDARVLSRQSLEHLRHTRPPRVQALELVAVVEDEVVAFGAAGLNIDTSTPGASWATVTVDARRRRAGIASSLGGQLIAHLESLGASKATTFVRQTDETERWAAKRGWVRVLSGPLIAVDPRRVPAPEPPEGFRCAPLSELSADAVFDAVREAALDEPSAVPNDNITLDEFRREWNDPIFDHSCGGVVLEGAEVAAFSFMKVAGERGQHGFTGTARAFRGKGLATTAKRFALTAAAARGVTRVTTSNAEQNVAMRAINRRLGFEAIGEHVILARDL